jgi:hypothetical protein
LSRCLIKHSKLRPSAEKLLDDKFVSKCKDPSILVELVETYKKAITKRGGEFSNNEEPEELYGKESNDKTSLDFSINLVWYIC